MKLENESLDKVSSELTFYGVSIVNYSIIKIYYNLTLQPSLYFFKKFSCIQEITLDKRYCKDFFKMKQLG